MEDAEGRYIDFRNTLILLTTNVGTELIMSMCKDPELMPEPEGIANALRQPLLKTFPAVLLGRLVAIPLLPAGRQAARRHHPLAARMPRQAHRREPLNSPHLRRCGGRTHRRTLPRGGERCPGAQCDSHQYRPVRNQPRDPRPYLGRGRVEAGRHQRCRGWVRVRFD